MSKDKQPREKQLKEGTFEVEGEVLAAQPNAMFKVKLESGMVIDCHVSGKIRKHFINILPGDKVTVVMSRYDLSKGRITYRAKG